MHGLPLLTVPSWSQEGLKTRWSSWATGIDPLSTWETSWDCARSVKGLSSILDLPWTSKLELISGIEMQQRKLRRSKTGKVCRSATSTGKAAGAMTWRLLTKHLSVCHKWGGDQAEVPGRYQTPQAGWFYPEWDLWLYWGLHCICVRVIQGWHHDTDGAIHLG